MPLRRSARKEKPTKPVFGKALARKRQAGRKPWMPQMAEIRAKATSKVAKQFFSHPKYFRRARLLVELFNKNPQRYFEFWSQSARGLVLMASEMGKRKKIGPNEIRALGDAFFAEYAPNALAESVRAEHFHFSGIMPPLSEKRYAEKRKALAGTPEYELYYRPVAEMLAGSTESQKSFDERIGQMMQGETLGHARLRMERDNSGMSQGERKEGTRLYFKKIEHAQMLRGLEEKGKRGEATRIRQGELLGRQLEAINEGHAALAMYLAPEVEKIDPKAWTMLKLAQAATRLS
jgi:hypothetical protein